MYVIHGTIQTGSDSGLCLALHYHTYLFFFPEIRVKGLDFNSRLKSC